MDDMDVELFSPVPCCRGGLDLSIQVGPGSGLAVVSGADMCRLGFRNCSVFGIKKWRSPKGDTRNNFGIAFR